MDPDEKVQAEIFGKLVWKILERDVNRASDEPRIGTRSNPLLQHRYVISSKPHGVTNDSDILVRGLGHTNGLLWG
jgi:hypothetical protein